MVVSAKKAREKRVKGKIKEQIILQRGQKDIKVNKEVRYKISEISQELIGYHNILSKFGIKDPRGDIAYSNAMKRISSMPYEEGKLKLVEWFNSARDAGTNTLDKITIDTMNKLQIKRQTGRRPYTTSYGRSPKYKNENEYRR